MGNFIFISATILLRECKKRSISAFIRQIVLPDQYYKSISCIFSELRKSADPGITDWREYEFF